MSIKSVKNLTLYIYSKPIHLLKTVPKKCFIIYSTRITTISTLDQVAEWCLNMQQVISEHILNQRILFYFYWLVWPTKYLLFYFNETALYVYLRLYVYILYNICPPFMSIWARFVLYVCDFSPKDQPYTSIEDCMAIRALKVSTCLEPTAFQTKILKAVIKAELFIS